jgi:hypothetical protein
MSPCKPVAGLVAFRLRLEPVGFPLVRGWRLHRAPRRQQDRRRRAERPLVRKQHRVGTAAVADVLVDVDDWVGRLSEAVTAPALHGNTQQGETGSRQEATSIHDTYSARTRVKQRCFSRE